MTALDELDPSTAPGANSQAGGRSAFWMPFTANRQFKSSPRLLDRAAGVHFWTPEGRRVLDGTAGLWCVNAGHCHPKITKAIVAQASVLDFAPTFQMGHSLAFELAEALATIAPAGLDRIFFTNSGSESVDTALKIALAYHRARGEGSRTRFIGRERGYHGVGFGGTSVGGIVGNRRQFSALLPGVDHLPSTHVPSEQAFSRGQPSYGAHLANELEKLVSLHDASTIAAVIVEPMAGSTGVLVPPIGYLERLRTICDRHGILLIFDEVITGFGRVGKAFAAQRFAVRPDLMTTAKGITNGAVPMGAVFASREVHDAIVHAGPGIELAHGYTYSGHPLACAAGLAMLELSREEGLFERALDLEGYWQDAVHALDLPGVVDIRSIGLVAGIELEPRAGQPGARAYEVFTRSFEAGILVRQTGETIALSPPLTFTKANIDELVGTLRDVLKTVA